MHQGRLSKSTEQPTMAVLCVGITPDKHSNSKEIIIMLMFKNVQIFFCEDKRVSVTMSINSNQFARYEYNQDSESVRHSVHYVGQKLHIFQRCPKTTSY